ncbi:MAG: SDR family NAD(P)-dependent oxidoreductase [Moorellales bacterium]
MERLKDRVAIVTGAARGIGRVFARRLAREGARVVAADILDVGETLEEVRAQGGEGLGVRVDVTSPTSAPVTSNPAISKHPAVVSH